MQESGVKVETLERRLDGTRKQADTILELENAVAKAKKQEKAYEEAIEQLQREQDALEVEYAKSKRGQGGDRQANASSSSAFDTADGPVTMVTSESAQTIEQVRACSSHCGISLCGISLTQLDSWRICGVRSASCERRIPSSSRKICTTIYTCFQSWLDLGMRTWPFQNWTLPRLYLRHLLLISTHCR